MVDSHLKVSITDITRTTLNNINDIWAVKCLPHVPAGSYNEHNKGENWDVLGKLMDTWNTKFKNVKTIFEFDMSEVIRLRTDKIKLVTDCLISELNDIKQQLYDIKEFDKYKVLELKNLWTDAVTTWKIDVREIEKDTTEKIKSPIRNFMDNIILTRQNIDIIPDLLMVLILELNHVILGNVQIVENTCLHLNILWQNYYRQWKIDYTYRTWDKQPDDEKVCDEVGDEDQEEDIFSERMLNIRNEILWLKEMRTKPLPEFLKMRQFLQLIQHLENCSNNIKTSETIIIECMESEYERLVSEKEKISEAKRVSRKSFEGKLKLESDLLKYNQYEERFADLAYSAKYFFESTSGTISKVVNAWNSLLQDRIEPVKRLTLLRLENVRKEFNGLRQDTLNSLNISIDQLRSAHSIASLEQMWHSNIEKAFGELEIINKKFFEKEYSVLEDFRQQVKLCYEVFIANLDSISQDSSSPSINSLPIQGSEYEINTVIQVDDDPFLNMVDFILKNANNWYNGFLDAVVLLRGEIDLNLLIIENDWIKRSEEELKWKQVLRLESQDQKFQRIKNDVFNIRATEIQDHEKAITRHVNGIYKAFVEMRNIEKSVEEQLKVVESNYEQAYKELLTIKEVGEDERKYHSILAIIGNVRVKLKTLRERRMHMGTRAMGLVERRFEWIHNTNTDLLSNIRLFKEGGNYSAEEATGVIYAINRISVAMKKEKRLLISRIRRIMRKRVESYSGVAERILEGMKKKTSEIAFKLQLQSILDRTRRVIKREFQKARDKINGLEELLSKRKKSRSILSWEDLVEEIVRCCSYFTLVTKEEDSIVKSKKSLRGTGRPSTVRRSVVYTLQRLSFRDSLIDFNLTSENFLFNINRFIKDCRRSLIHTIQKYYTTQLSLRGIEKRKKTSVQNEAGELLMQFENILKQLRHKGQIVWLNMIYDLLCLIYLFKVDLKSILESKCNIYKSVCMSRLANIERAYLDQISKYVENEEAKLHTLKDKLRALFGLPKNKAIMDDLEKQALDTCTQSISCYKSSVNAYRQEVKGFIIGFMDVSKRLVEETAYFIDSIYMNNSLDDFIKIVEKQVKKLSALKKHRKARKSDKTFSDLEENVEEEEDSLNPSCIMQNLPHLLQLIQCSLNLLTEPSDCQQPKECTLPELPLNCEKIVHNVQHEVNAECRRIVESAVEAYTIYGSKIQKWYRNWKFDTDEIQKLYL